MTGFQTGASAVDGRRLSWAGDGRWVLMWMVGMAVLALLRIGAAPLFDVDEGAFSEATREMLASGDWGHTTLNGEDRFDKPILIYWLQALSVSVFGLSEWALRLPSALATWGWATSVVLWIWPRWGVTAALGAGSVLGSCLGVLLIGRAATADAVLNLWLVLAAQDLWRHLEAPSGHVSARWALRRAALWMGLGILTKGPVAVIVPGAAVMIWVLVSGRAAWGARLKSLLADGAAWALMLLVAVPWYVYALNRHGMAFVDGFFIRHNLQRYGGTLEGHGGSLGYYFVMLPLLLLPWSVLLGPALAGGRRTWADPLGRFLWGWAGFVLVFFSLSGTKLPHYALYGITPLAVLCGRALSDGLAGRMRWPAVVSGGLLVGLAGVPLLLVGVSALAQRRVGEVKDVLYQALLSQPASLDAVWMAAGLASAAVFGLWWGTRWPRSEAQALPGPAGVLRLALAGGVAAAVLVGGLAPWWGNLLQGPVRDAGLVARQALREAPAGTSIVQWGLHFPSLAVHVRHEAPRRPPRPGDLALLRTDQWPVLSSRLAQEQRGASARPRADILFERGGMTLVRWLDPVEP